MQNNRRSTRGSASPFPDYPAGMSGMCTAALGSMTKAIQAERVLADASIRCTVTKISSSRNTKGCVYGVVFPCAQFNNVRTVLSQAGIGVRQYIDSIEG